MMVLIRFWRSLTKKESVKSASVEMKYNICSSFTPVLGRFFHGSGFFRIGSGFLADLDTNSKNTSDPDPGKKPGSETLF